MPASVIVASLVFDPRGAWVSSVVVVDAHASRQNLLCWGAASASGGSVSVVHVLRHANIPGSYRYPVVLLKRALLQKQVPSSGEEVRRHPSGALFGPSHGIRTSGPALVALLSLGK